MRGLEAKGEEGGTQPVVSGASLSGFEFQLTTRHLDKWMSISESQGVMCTLVVTSTAASRGCCRTKELVPGMQRTKCRMLVATVGKVQMPVRVRRGSNGRSQPRAIWTRLKLD